MSAESTQERSPLLKRALFALRDMQSRVNALERSQREPIAIIGMGCRFPGNCRDADSYWHLLRDGIDSIGPIPESRWDVDAFYDADPNAPGKMYTRHGGFLSEIDAFDANFFGISPREAVGIDHSRGCCLRWSGRLLKMPACPSTLLQEAAPVFSPESPRMNTCNSR